MISSARREDIVSALRRGTVPSSGLDALAVGIDTFAPTLDDELESVSAGRGGFKAVRGEYGTGKTFFGRWLQERARARGFAATEVQINETETPLHRLETVYRRLVEHLGTADTASGAFRGVIDGWFYALEQDVLADTSVDASDAEGLLLRTNALMEARLGAISKTAPAFSAVLRTYRRALAAGDGMLADGLISWLAGQPNVAASIKRAAGIKGDLDHFGATNFLVGLLTILRDSGFSGLVMVLDEVETLQRMRTDTREKGLNALRQWIDEIDAGRYPGLYLVITGTPAFYDGPQGVQRLAPLAQRLHVDFGTDRRFDNPRAVQIRLAAFDHTSLLAVGRRVRDIYADGRPTNSAFGRWWTTAIWTPLHARWPAGWVARSVSRPVCSSRSWCRMCWTAWTCTNTSTPASTTPSRWPRPRCLRRSGLRQVRRPWTISSCERVRAAAPIAAVPRRQHAGLEHAATDATGSHCAHSCGLTLFAARTDRRGEDGSRCDSDAVEDADRGLARDERLVHLPDQGAAEQPGASAHPLRRAGGSACGGVAWRHLAVPQEPGASRCPRHPVDDTRIHRGHADFGAGRSASMVRQPACRDRR